MAEHETNEVTVTLPTGVAERLGDDEAAMAETLSSLAADHAAMQRSIEQFTDRGDGPPLGTESDAGTVDLAETPPPIGQLLGFELVSAEDGESVISFQPGPEHANPMGTLHGGILCDLGDLAMGTAYASTLGPDESFTTLELDVKFRRPVWDQPLTATGTVVDGGRTVGLVECDVTGPEGELIAHLQSVCMTLRDEQAAGR